MSIFDTIRSRRSVRTFDGKPLRQEDTEQITALFKTDDSTEYIATYSFNG